MSVITTGIALDNGGKLTYKKFTLDYATIAAIGDATSGNVTLFTLPQAGFIVYVRVKHTAQFVGVGGTFKVSVGTSGSATLFTAQTGDLVATAVAATTYTENAGSSVPHSAGTHAAVAIVANCVSSSGNLSGLTAGSVDIYVAYANVTTPSA